MNIFSITRSRYILILVVVGLSPILLNLSYPESLRFKPLPTESSYNQDTQQNNQFQVVFNAAPIPTSQAHIYVDAYLLKRYLFLGQEITIPIFTRKFLMDSSGRITIPDLESGKYLLWPKSIPIRLKLLNQFWILDVKDRNPDPLTIRL